MNKPNVIAEIGCNHKGDLELAKEMISVAKECGAEVVKLQKRDPKQLLTEDQYNAPHPNPANSYGETYGAHREFLEFDANQHRELLDHCKAEGIVYSTSVWDMNSARDIVALNPDLIKVPSACNFHTSMLEYLCSEYSGEVHVSLGMTTRDEEEKIIELFEKNGKSENLVIYSCTSGYPVEFEDICLREITRLLDAYGKRVKTVGFSGHHLGIAADIAAMTLGATWIERHFTLDRTWKGTDHAASLEPQGLKKLVRDLLNVAKSLEFRDSEILAVEEVQRKKLKWNLHHSS